MSQDWLLAMAGGEREQNQGCNDDVYSPLKLNKINITLVIGLMVNWLDGRLA